MGTLVASTKPACEEAPPAGAADRAQQDSALTLAPPAASTRPAPSTPAPSTPAPSTPADARTDEPAVAVAVAPVAGLRVQVIVREPVRLLDYAITPELRDVLRPGIAVRVPLGKRVVAGYVADIVTGPAPQGVTLRCITELDHQLPALPRNLMRLIIFAADYYAATHGEMLTTALPAPARATSRRYRLSDDGREAHARGGLPAGDVAIIELAARFPKGFTVVAVEKAARLTRRAANARLTRLVGKGWLQRSEGRRPTTRRQDLAYERVASGGALAPADDVPADDAPAAVTRLWRAIPATGPIRAAQLAEAHPGAYARLRALERRGLLRAVHLPLQRSAAADPQDDAAHAAHAETPHELTAAQAAAIEQVTAAAHSGRFAAFLLQGVTGSGKTEVYLRVIDDVLASGRTALVLVPEIALTPQLGARFRARFGDRVATFHSKLTPVERRDEWERVAAGKASIGLGARSALVLPLNRLGVIIVDEEHESSFKQEDGPRYHARDLAVVRAQHDNAVVLLGSATPSIESWANAERGRYARLSLPARIGDRPLPPVECVDLCRAERVGDGILTAPLAQALEATLRRDEQAIIFLNRRGFAPYVHCRDCGHACRCPDCDVSLTLHRQRGIVLCHYCGFEVPAPDACPQCAGHRMQASGLGTERLEAELMHLFGPAGIVRLDRDAVRRHRDLERELARFRRGEARLMLGTQMVAKGHDFPGVTLVGVIAADASLNFPDFRAAERTFALLTQVAGRAGRADKPGRVVVQAFEIDHYAVRAAAAHSYEQFIDHELHSRHELGYPPFKHLALLRFESASETAAASRARDVARRIEAETSRLALPVKVLGPAPAPLTRLRNIWRLQVLLKSDSRRELRLALGALDRPPASVRQILDVDPFNML